MGRGHGVHNEFHEIQREQRQYPLDRGENAVGYGPAFRALPDKTQGAAQLQDALCFQFFRFSLLWHI